MATTRIKSTGALIEAVRYFKDNPDGTIRGPDWTTPTWTADDFWSWFRRSLSNKINSHDPRYPTGRKAGVEYETELGRLRHYIGNRIIVDWVAPILGPRVKSSLSRRMREN